MSLLSPKYDGELKRDVHTMLRPVVPLHFAVVRTRNDANVYMMLRDLDDAKVVFDMFHAQWFKYKGVILIKFSVIHVFQPLCRLSNMWWMHATTSASPKLSASKLDSQSQCQSQR